jgi:aspartate aminotransferase
MINEHYKEMLGHKSVIRELAEYAAERGREIGYDNVYDYSLGNPSVPTAPEYTREVIRLHEEEDPVKLHGYSPSLGNDKVRCVLADYLRNRFGLPYEKKHIFMTSGATGAIAHAVRAVTKPGDTILTFAPFFPEYMPYINGAGVSLSVVPADTRNFQIDFDKFEEMLTEDIAAVLINSPNNPSGAVYSSDTLERMAKLLRKKEEEYQHDIFLISDEPYREIVYDGKTVPYPAAFYDNTLTCYSFSKSLSLPGERIGYVAANPSARDADIIALMCGQISRGIGHNCPSSTSQLGMAAAIDKTADLSVYETNRNILYEEFKKLGFDVVKPEGTFYIFPKALEDDAVAFCRKAMKYDLILVPSDNFGVNGYFRVAYCIGTDKVRRSLPVFEKFVKTEYFCK